jgi:hypothetical protein
MPALPAVSKVIRTALRFNSTDADSDIISRFFTSYSGSAPTDAELVAWCTAVAGNFATNCAGLYPSVLQLVEVSAEDLTSATSAVGDYTAAAAGSRSGAPLSAGAAMVISYKIARRYRGGHPRGYWPFGTAADLTTQDEWGSTFLTDALSDFNAFGDANVTSGWSGAGTLAGVNVSYYEGFTNHTYPSGRVRAIPTLRGTPVIDPIIANSINPKVGSQRRRNQQGA